MVGQIIKKISGTLSKAKRWAKGNSINIETFMTLKSYVFKEGTNRRINQ